MAEAKVSGYKIREAVRQLEVKKSALRNQFNGSFYKFDDEEKDTPLVIGDAIDTIESQIARIQEVQAQYNLAVQVPFKGQEISLLRAIKLVGGKGRIEGMWRKIANPKSRRYSYDDNVGGPSERRDDVTLSKAVLTDSQCTEEAIKAMELAGALRAAIANGNTTEISLDVDPDLTDLIK